MSLRSQKNKDDDGVLRDGEPWLLKFDEVNHIECCDCGLVHAFYITPVVDGITITHYRDEYRTDAARKEKGIEVRRKKKRGEQ